MNDNSGSLPYDPRMVPAQPGQGALPGLNGPVTDRIAAAPLPPVSAPAPIVGGGKDRQFSEQKDAFREIVETVVFVVVLVLLLKAFMAEAFVIPTGSMATTLLGYHRSIVCPECGERFPLNLSKEMDAAEQYRQEVKGCTCPNCHLHIDWTNSNQFPRPKDRDQ
jgi:hypothetical protein